MSLMPVNDINVVNTLSYIIFEPNVWCVNFRYAYLFTDYHNNMEMNQI